MRDEHITAIIDNTPFAALSETDMHSIRAHTANCADCARAFKAAQVSSLLVAQRAEETAQNALNANPFFQTRVLAAWREQQASAWSLRRLWNETGALVSSMAAVTALLAALTFAIPAEESTAVPTTAVASASAESVMFDEGQDEMTNEQALNAIYYEEEEAR
jgi:anti-sigma-K factor RskA